MIIILYLTYNSRKHLSFLKKKEIVPTFAHNDMYHYNISYHFLAFLAFLGFDFLAFLGFETGFFAAFLRFLPPSMVCSFSKP